MFKLRKFWDKLLCRWGFHDWTQWNNCKHHWDTHEFRTCMRCPKKECQKTLIGVLADDQRLEEELRRDFVSSMAEHTLIEMETHMVKPLELRRQ